jgi:hypothetical protein
LHCQEPIAQFRGVNIREEQDLQPHLPQNLKTSNSILAKCGLSYFLFFFFFQALNFLFESFGLLNDLFPLPSILDAGYPVFDLHLADVLCDVILPSVLGYSL